MVQHNVSKTIRLAGLVWFEREMHTIYWILRKASRKKTSMLALIFSNILPGNFRRRN
jgi:hypothetical protein